MKNVISAQVLLQMVLYFSGYFLILFYAGLLLLLCYKGLALPYPARNFWPELVLLLVLASLDGVRVFLGVKGNLTQRKIPIAVSLVLLVPVFVGYLFTFEVAVLVLGYLGMLLQILVSPFVLWIMHRSTSPL